MIRNQPAPVRRYGRPLCRRPSTSTAGCRLRFSSYQKFVVAMLAFLQFTIVLDFMMLSPLGALVMPALKITPSQFGLVVSTYAFSAGLSGLLTAGFADRFDRKKLLLVFYAGFVAGTLLCGLASTLSHAVGRADGDGTVCRSRGLGVLRDRHGSVPDADARPRHGNHSDGVRGQHGDGHPAGPVSVESLGLERTVFHGSGRQCRWWVA